VPEREMLCLSNAVLSVGMRLKNQLTLPLSGTPSPSAQFPVNIENSTMPIQVTKNVHNIKNTK
jgi:hypothetical protein